MWIENAFGRHELRRIRYAGSVDTVCDDVVAALSRHGFAVIEDAMDGPSCDRLVDEMRPYLDATPHGLHGLGGTRRVGALVARSPTSHRMIAHPAVLAVARAVLSEQRLAGDEVSIGGRRGPGERGFRYPYQLHLTQIIDVGPGGGSDTLPHALGLHRANGMWVHDFQSSHLDPQLEVMWALTDFSAENGATHVVLGSHRDDPRGGPRAFSEATIQATMPKGSALIWTGWSVHGAGINRSSSRRIGMNINYALAFLAQEENQLLACPPEMARQLPEDLQRLIGYRQPAGSLNYVAECQAPRDSVLKADFDVRIPGAHGHSMDPTIDGPLPSRREIAELVARAEQAQAAAIEADDLETALLWQKTVSVLQRRPVED